MAIVTSAGEPSHVMADLTRPGLLRRVAAYVAEWAPHKLWPADAERVERLLAAGCDAEAVEHYFAHVGHRWDRECLTIREIDLLPDRAGRSAAVAGLVTG